MSSALKHLITFVLVGLLVLSTLSTSEIATAQVLAPNWVVYDVENNLVLDDERMNQRVPMASLTKLMTGLLVVERLSMEQTVTIVAEDLVGEASIWVEEGDEYAVRTLLYGLMMRSGNDAAAALARSAGGSPDRESRAARVRFTAMMNLRADELGMDNTQFRNPHGLDEDGHYSSARDLARLTRAVLDEPVLKAAFGAESFSGEGMTFEHTNQLPTVYDGVLGGKTGWTTDAGLCLIQVVERDGRTLIVVLLGSTFERWYPDAIELLDHGWTVPLPATTDERAAYAFDWWRLRTDGPVQNGSVERSWLWGPEPVSTVRKEPYRNAVDGQRRIQYFDKGRMEINDPEADVTSGWYITGGHLARELITGRRQTGDTTSLYRGPAREPVAGDPDGGGPTYADLATLVDSSFHDPGDVITLHLDAGARSTFQTRLARHDVELVESDSATGHGIAAVFDDYLDQFGPVIERGTTVETRLFEPRYALVGLPITEPAWVRVPVDGQLQDVLVQCFERRCLTYTPDNPDDWQVEMGNIGQHYMAWNQSNRIYSLHDREQLRQPDRHGVGARQVAVN